MLKHLTVDTLQELTLNAGWPTESKIRLTLRNSLRLFNTLYIVSKPVKINNISGELQFEIGDLRS